VLSKDRWVKEMLERQAAWQRGRASLSWEEKLRQSLGMREAQRSLRNAIARGRPAFRADIARESGGARPGSDR
jgi:hypothetical protein